MTLSKLLIIILSICSFIFTSVLSKSHSICIERHIFEKHLTKKKSHDNACHSNSTNKKGNSTNKKVNYSCSECECNLVQVYKNIYYDLSNTNLTCSKVKESYDNYDSIITKTDDPPPRYFFYN